MSSSEQKEPLIGNVQYRGKSKYPDPAICTFCPFDVYPFAVLIGICLITFGSYWVFDIPGALQKPLTEWFGPSYTDASNAALYSVYSFPNIILAYFGGILVDMLGVRFSAILFCFLIMLGQVVFSIGIQFKIYAVALAGRFIFGLGGESLTVSQNSFTARWFEGPFLAMAFGIVVSFSRLGSAINFVVSPALTNEGTKGIPIAIWVGTATTLISFLASAYVSALDKYGEKRIKEKPKEKPSFSQAMAMVRDIRLMPLAAWILFLICVFFYIAVLTFYTVASELLQRIDPKHYSSTQASTFLFIPNVVSIICSPLFGYLIDKVGITLFWLGLATVMLVVPHAVFLYETISQHHIPPVPIFIFLGVAYSLGCASMWPALTYYVPNRLLGSAYGTMTALQNAGLAFAPLILSTFFPDPSKHFVPPVEYQYAIIFFMGSVGIAFIFVIILYFVDSCMMRGILSSFAARREQLKIELGLGEEQTPDPTPDDPLKPVGTNSTFNL